VDEVTRGSIPPYRGLLEVARALGCADGCWAAQAGLADPPAVPPAACRGRTPGEFARLLWGRRPADPPSGLVLNAPLWYADGFAEGLAAEPRRPEPVGTGWTVGPLEGAG
jgi:hypothetical protein